MKINFRWTPLQDATDAGAGGSGGGEGKAGGETIVGGGDNKTTETGAGKKPDAKETAGKGDEGKAGKTDDTKTGKEGAGTETGGKDGKGADDASKPKAPEKYALTIPEGGRLDELDLKYVEKLARDADMTNEQAQAWIDEQDAAIQAQSDRFLTETKADKDLGGDKLEQTQQLARQAIDRVFPKGDPHRDGFLKFLNRGGAGNNIHVVRAFVRIGKLMAEDTATGGTGGAGGKQDAASKFYDNPTSPKA